METMKTKAAALEAELRTLLQKEKINVNDAIRLEILIFIAINSDFVDMPEVTFESFDKGRNFFLVNSSARNLARQDKVLELLNNIYSLLDKSNDIRKDLQLFKERMEHLAWSLGQFEYIEGVLLKEKMLPSEKAAIPFSEEHINSLTRTIAIEPYKDIASEGMKLGVRVATFFAALNPIIEAVAKETRIDELLLLCDYDYTKPYNFVADGKLSVIEQIANKGKMRRTKLERLDYIYQDLKILNPANFEYSEYQLGEIQRMARKACREKAPLLNVLKIAIKTIKSKG